MHKNATKCNETKGKWCKNKHGASKIIDTFETYQQSAICQGGSLGHGVAAVFCVQFPCISHAADN
jgi:hypothetical protein